MPRRKSTMIEFLLKFRKLEELESSTKFKDDLDQLKKLVMLNENLKQQEQAFKKNCKQQLSALKDGLAKLQAAGDNSEESNRLKEIEDMYAQMQKKFNKLRKLLAKRSQEVALVSRQIDDIPTRTELLQYERRFVELYEQVSLKLEENRKHVSTYNTLENTYTLLKKEVSLIQSVTDNFQQAMKSKAGKEQFLKQLQDICAGLEKRGPGVCEARCRDRAKRPEAGAADAAAREAASLLQVR